MGLMLTEHDQYISLRESFVVLMLVHHILTMAAIQYEPIISDNLCNKMILLQEALEEISWIFMSLFMDLYPAYKYDRDNEFMLQFGLVWAHIGDLERYRRRNTPPSF